ncbi:Acyl-CoA synthetase (AMP-forming)/AMP-acid ligase II [Roseateles sp. YR242]|uniref:long-chain-fatty-acid--CoA ligase n=1 Tax=Roseateles sp. YR242 TaxID=1855305 RepID=UPI0008D423A2|nr:long-chain-fatty-acid--CoA ligase [Roseateles sp. YR242]SEL22943.1 Acyl-CoA synthetase (AMP-forming)/AMP-acid ligase II [Roseateles sp. YR242]
MHLTQALHKALREQPDRDAVICGAERLSFRRFTERVARLAGALKQLGVAPGDRVGLLALNSARSVEFLYGCWWSGAVINPVNVRWTPGEIAYSLDDCDTRVLLVDRSFAPMIAALRQQSSSLATVIYCGDGPTPEGLLSYEALLEAATPVEDGRFGGDHLAAVMYTGGTTGRPKGVMLSHANLYLNGLCAAAAVPRPERGVGMVVAPFFHVGGCGLSLQMMQRLVTQVVIPFFDEVAIFEAMQGEGVTETFLVPSMIKRLVEHPRFGDFRFPRFAVMLYGAAPIDATLLAQAMDAWPGAQFSQAYGMTELAPTICVLSASDHLPGAQQARRLRSAGRPVAIAEVRIVDAEDQELPAGQVGEIVARGPMVMRGYWNRPEETAQALRNGWMHTGDGGFIDEDGYVHVVDRIKDMIVSGGENVYSAEVENAIALHPSVSMSAVIGVPDERWGERVHAVVVLRPGAALEETALITFCRDHIAGYKVPRSVEFRTELPLSPAGKLQKFVLREPFWAGRDRRVN